MEYTQEEQDLAIKTLSNLVKENQKLRGELNKANEFCLRMLLSEKVEKTDSEVYFYDNGVVRYSEDFEKLLDYFFFNYYPNSNANVKDGMYKSTFSVLIKNATQFPPKGNIESIKDKLTSFWGIEFNP